MTYFELSFQILKNVLIFESWILNEIQILLVIQTCHLTNSRISNEIQVSEQAIYYYCVAKVKDTIRHLIYFEKKLKLENLIKFYT